MQKIRLFASLALALVPSLASAASPPSKPRLMVVMVIDQFRADYLTRFVPRFLPAHDGKGKVGGFRYLMTQGAYFPFAEYDLLQCMTGPGHATVLTGSYPYQSGIPINGWFNPATEDYVYCTEDQDAETVGAVVADKHVGTSPKNLIGSTVGDELKNAGYPSKVVSLALKDRAAILMGGHRPDIAIWFDVKSFGWVTSKYYRPDGTLPQWLSTLDHEIAAGASKPTRWELPKESSGLSATDAAPIPSDANARAIGPAFPHEAAPHSKGTLTLPAGIEMTEQLAELAIKNYKLGEGPSVDLLAISFSSHDYLGHAFGPNSREMEEMTVAEDRNIAKLLNYVRNNVPGGLDSTVVVLTGDHGIVSNADWLKSHGMDAGRIEETSTNDRLNSVLDEKFGKPSKGKWIPLGHDFNWFISPSALAEKKVEKAAVESVVKAELLKLPGVAHVVTSSEYAARKLPPGMHERQVLHSYYPGRSGDVVIIPKPFYAPQGNDTTDHNTGYSYDRMVPLIFAGRAFRPGVYATKAQVIDLAPTLSFLAGTVAPAASEGRVLSEALVGTGGSGTPLGR